MAACRKHLRARNVAVGLTRAIGRLFSVIAVGSTLSAACAFADDIFGTWMRDDKAARVTVAECGTSICATNVWIRDPQRQHEKVGDRLVFQVRRRGDSWTGTAHDPQRDLNFSATLHAEGAEMTTRGCMFGGLVCRTTNWVRQ
jgi:uncharacterized protein (DUF2147 family)